MHTNDIKRDALKGNEEFVDYLHAHARKEKIPATCDKAWLAMAWRNSLSLTPMFAMLTSKTVRVPNVNEFYKQAAESYKG